MFERHRTFRGGLITLQFSRRIRDHVVANSGRSNHSSRKLGNPTRLRNATGYAVQRRPDQQRRMGTVA